MILATDEDREGESISHHLVEVLQPKVTTKRMVFHEITKEAISEALQNFREVDTNLVRAQESRRILDRLYGYSLSPLLWKKIAYGLSAGRVQSVATRLIVEREEQRIRFKKGIYCGILADLKAAKGDLETKLIRLGEKRIATGKDFDEHTGAIEESKKKDIYLLLKKEADDLEKVLAGAKWTVREVNEKPLTRKPAPPFITSTLQQEANRKLGLSARDAMRVAQGLYEKGFITYMRTDSVNLSSEALSAARRQIESLYGKDHLSDGPRQFASKSKGAQEAHEAIRPAGTVCPTPQETGLSGLEFSLYDLIWKRTVATQMADAKLLNLSINIDAQNPSAPERHKHAEFQATGTRIIFPGFLRAYVEGQDDAEAALEEREVLLPEVKAGEALKLQKSEVTEHETKPPARFTEASLVQTLEKEGVGRPSTYASIISTIIDRGYVRRLANALVPTFTAFAVVNLLKKHFSELVDLKFTASMEETLDEIAEGKKPYLEFLKDFYSDKKNGLRSQIETREKKIDPDESRAIAIETFPDVEFRIGRFGPYLAQKQAGSDESIRASIPEDIAPADLELKTIDKLIQMKKDGPPHLGVDPVSGKKVYAMTGRYGPYLQLGEAEDADAAKAAPKPKKKKSKKVVDAQKIDPETGEVLEAAAEVPEEKPIPKVKRSVVPKGVDPSQLSLTDALGYLNLPRVLGTDKEGHKVSAGLGRFGPYIVKSGAGLEKPEYRSLKKEDDVLYVNFDRAIEIFAEPRTRGTRGRSKAVALRVVGQHPIEKKPIEIFNGPYGLYVKCAKINASIPKEIQPDDLSLEKAIELIEARRR
ncbi:MAG: type I DNA topoisomerase [Deltaproteobacteria bacterium]|nr:type I DNA topoisomerase [Deltaproteobacteria bacterium]